MRYEGLILDVDGVIVPSLHFWYRANSLAGTIGLIDGVYIPQYLDRKIDYRVLNATAVRLWKENKVALGDIRKIVEDAPLRPGVETFIDAFRKRHSDRIALLSTGLDVLVDDVKRRLKINYSLCNILEMENGDYTGNVTYFVDDRELNKGLGARKLCEEMGVDPKNVLAVVDGLEDVPLCDVVGTVIAVNPQHKTLEEKAGVTLKNVEDLSDLLKYI